MKARSFGMVSEAPLVGRTYRKWTAICWKCQMERPTKGGRFKGSVGVGRRFTCAGCAAGVTLQEVAK